MSSLVNRFRNELFNAEIDLNSGTITQQEHDGAITVTAKPGRVRLFFTALFAKSLRLFSMRTDVIEPLAPRGVITLTWTGSKSGNQSKGCNTFTITISPGTGLVFMTINDYLTARAFTDRLAVYLSFPLEDRVPLGNRS